MKKTLTVIISILVLCFVVALAIAFWPTSSPKLTADKTKLSDPEFIEKGRYLAVLGDCVACHTSNNNVLFAGGNAIDSPIGEMFPPNITPDKKKGIGNYSLDDFDRAVRFGIRQDGVTLYPAMPYPSYARMSDEDITALYAYFMNGVKPEAVANKENTISWPLSIRWPVAIWRKVFAPEVKPFDAQKFSENLLARGAYIVEGPGHCGTCHTPRAATMQEKALDDSSAFFLAGGQIVDGWNALSLRNEPSGLQNWSQDEIVELLLTGRTAKAVIIGKPMHDVIVHSSSLWTDEDRNAVAAYLKSLPAEKAAVMPTQPVAADMRETNSEAAFLYRRGCSNCHGIEGQGKEHLFPALVGNNTVLAEDPTTIIRLTAHGYVVPPLNDEQMPMQMPGFAGTYSDKQIADVLTYVRQSWGNNATVVTEKQVSAITKEK